MAKLNIKLVKSLNGRIAAHKATAEALGLHTLATNSPKMAFYAPGNNGFDVWYGSEEQCIKTALTGRWED